MLGDTQWCSPCCCCKQLPANYETDGDVSGKCWSTFNADGLSPLKTDQRVIGEVFGKTRGFAVHCAELWPGREVKLTAQMTYTPEVKVGAAWIGLALAFDSSDLFGPVQGLYAPWEGCYVRHSFSPAGASAFGYSRSIASRVGFNSVSPGGQVVQNPPIVLSAEFHRFHDGKEMRWVATSPGIGRLDFTAPWIGGVTTAEGAHRVQIGVVWGWFSGEVSVEVSQLSIGCEHS